MNVEKFHDRLKELYSPPEAKFALVDVPEIRFATIDGEGDPQGATTAEAIKWLYALVHVVKPSIQERMGKDFSYPPIEFLHWAEKEADFIPGNKEKWKWQAMIVFVDWISQEAFADAIIDVEKKYGKAPDSLRLESLHEGQCVQYLHRGSYDEIGELCKSLFGNYLPANNLKPRGRYHEIFLNDPARTASEKRKTLIRQPVESTVNF